MALAKHYHRQPQPHSLTRKSSGGGGGSASPPATATDVKRLVNHCMNRLSDRDTEPMAAAELESMARSLPAGSLPSFLSAISDARPSDKTPLRRHSVRLLATLSKAHPPGSLAPLFPRMLSALTRRLRDPDSSVRAACAEAAGQIAAAGCPPAVFIRVLSESLLLEQDHNAQIGAALCLAAAVDASAAYEEDGNSDDDNAYYNNGDGCAPRLDLAPQLLRLLPRLLKLAKADAFKAKPALVTLLGAVAAAGGASTPAALGVLIPCLNEFLASDDWAARKAAAEALSRVAAIDEAHLLATFKASCITSYESRRFDKVKIVRESMNQMLEAWKDLPEEAAGGKGSNNNADTQGVHYSATATSMDSKDVASDGCFPPASRNAGSAKYNATDVAAARKNRFPTSRSPPPEATTPAPTNRRNVATPATDKRVNTPPLFRKLDRNNKKPADWKIEIAVPYGQPVKVVHEDNDGGGGTYENVGGSFENNRPNRFGHLKSRANRVVPVLDKESSGSAPGEGADELVGMKHKESGELASIHKQLVQIENQQSSLMELLQKFIGSSQDGMRSLETRVRGLEMALDEISQDMAVSGRMGSDSFASTCWKLPGAEFLSSRLWRRTEGRYPRYSVSGSSVLTGGIRPSTDRDSNTSSNWDKRQFGIRGGFVNPLAEVNPQHEISSKRVIRSAMHDSTSTSIRDTKQYDGPIAASTCGSAPGMTNRST